MPVRTVNRHSVSTLMALVYLLALVSAGTQDNRDKEKVLSALKKSIVVFWVVTSCSLVSGNQHYGRTYHLLSVFNMDAYKRQIFREQVLPHSGGKIPDDAFRADRLALNRLNKDGISVPDGILLDARRHEKHPSLRHNSDLEMSIIKLVLTPDGRYVPPEGRYHYQNPVTVDSTYVIRPPIGSYKHELRHRPAPIRQPIPVPLELPAKPEPDSSLPLYLEDTGSYFFQSHHGLFSDHFYPFYTPQTLTEDLSAFFEHFHDHGRLVRHSPARIYHSQGSKIPGVEGKDYPTFSHIPETGFTCNGIRQKDKMYADKRTGCQVFHFCQKDGRQDSFLCPKGTVFNQALSHCDWWYNVKCG